MASATDNRFLGIQTSLAIKAPVRVATTANITLSGLQTIDGVALVADDRVLVKDQTDTTENGIYRANTSAWQRAPDFDGNRDVALGTWVYVTNGTAGGGGSFRVNATNPVTVGTTAMTFDLATLGLPTTLTSGGVAYASGATSITVDAANFFWDASNKRLGIGTNAPSSPLHILGTSAAGHVSARIANASANGFNTFWLSGANNAIIVGNTSASVYANEIVVLGASGIVVGLYPGSLAALKCPVVASSVNWLTISGSITTSAPVIGVNGSDTNIGITYNTKGTGGHAFQTAAGAAPQLLISHTASTVNYHTFTGSVTGANQVTIWSMTGTDTHISIGIKAKGNGCVIIGSGVSVGSNPTRDLQIFANQATRSALAIQASGATSGERATIDFIANNGTALASLGQVAAAANFFSFHFSAGADFYTGSGVFTGGVPSFRIGNTASSVNFIGAFGNATGAAPYFAAVGTDTNIGLGYLTAGTGAHTFYSGGGARIIAQFLDLASSVNYWSFSPATAAAPRVSCSALGTSADIGMQFVVKGDGDFRWNGQAYNAMILTVTAAATGVINLLASGPNIFISNSSATGNVYYGSAGSGAHIFYSQNSGSNVAAVFAAPASAVNYVAINGSATLVPTNMTLTGSDTNISLNIIPKGTGKLYVGSGTASVMTEVVAIAVGDETTAITTGVSKVTFRMPFAMTLESVRASLTTASSSGIPTVDINESGATILSTKLTIDASEKTSTTAATPAVISDTALADDAEMTIDIDVAGTGAAGLKVYLIGQRTS